MLTSQTQKPKTAPPNVNPNKILVLIEAIKKNNQEKVFRLLNPNGELFGKKAINEVDADGASPLYWAAVCGHVHFIAPLFKAGADVNKPDKDRTTPVLIAAQMGHAAVITTLKSVGANMDTPANDGVTPIYIAAQNGHAAAMAALLEAGADISGKTPWGTALECAKQGKEPEHKEVVRLLEVHFKKYLNEIKPAIIMHQAVSFSPQSTSFLEQKNSGILTQFNQPAGHTSTHAGASKSTSELRKVLVV